MGVGVWKSVLANFLLVRELIKNNEGNWNSRSEKELADAAFLSKVKTQNDD